MNSSNIAPSKKTSHQVITTKPPRISRMLGFMFNPRILNNPALLRNAVEGKIILVTGASFGLGEATAKLLANAGATVLVVARTQDKLNLVATEIEQAGGKVFSYTTDLSDVTQIESLVEQILNEHGRVDIVINNAGKSIRRSVTLSFDRFKDYERTNAINYLGPVRLILALLPSMKENGGGHIVNVSTIGVRIPPGARWAAYQASKGAFDIWFRSIAIEMEQFGVTTSTIYMALIYTRMSSPTPIFRVVPGLFPEEAAHLIERAVVKKPREISPPWLSLAEKVSTLFRGPTNWLYRLMYKHTTDTEASKSRTLTGGK